MTRALSALELAAALGVSRQAIAKQAKQKNWSSVSKRHAGGPPRKLFLVDGLPEDIRERIDSHEPVGSVELRALGAKSNLVDRYAQAPAAHRDIAHKRLRAVELYLRERAGGATVRQAAQRVLEEYGHRRSSVSAWVKLIEDAPLEDWAALLMPSWVSKAQPAPIHPDAWNWYLSDRLRKTKPSHARCYERLLAAAKEHPEWGAIPSLKSLKRRYAREVPRTVEVYKREGSKALDRMFPRVRRDKRDLEALVEINGDGREFDVFVKMPTRDLGAKPRILRPTILAWQDTYSGVFVGWTLAETENWDATRIALHNVIQQWGIPDSAWVDNGHAFAAKIMTAGAGGRRHRYKDKPSDPDGVMKGLSIEVGYARPGSPHLKDIESAFGKLAERIDKHPLCEGAYVGHKVDAKPEDYASRAVPFEQFRELVTREIENWNNAPADTLVCQGRPRLGVFRESLAARVTPPKQLTAAQLQSLLMVCESKRVSTVGSAVTLLGTRFHAPEMFELQGKYITVRYDSEDLAKGVWVYKPGSLTPICHAPPVSDVKYRSKEEARIVARVRHIEKKAIKDASKAMGTLSARELAEPTKPKRQPREGNVIAADFATKSLTIPRTVAGHKLTAEHSARVDALAEEMLARLGAGA